jgi:hypothetical protein
MDRNDLFKKLFEGCNGYIELRAIKRVTMRESALYLLTVAGNRSGKK